jgi:Flp pilus assembly protein TadG
MSSARSERGQVTVLTAVFMVVLLGLGGFVLDVGSWFRQQRVSQATVDAAALAGAQALPTDPSTAMSLATQYANENGGVAGASITIGTKYKPNDTITVSQARSASGIFSGLFGLGSATTHARATAIAEIPTEVTGAAPIVVDIKHPMLSGPGCPCFNVPTTIPLGKVDSSGSFTPGAFGLVDFDQSTNGGAGSSELSDWITNGYQHYLPLGNYDSDTGAKFSSTDIQTALQLRYGSDLLFPVFNRVSGNGSNAQFHIIGWASFHVTLVQAGGNSGTISGYFDRVIWDGIIPTDGSGDSTIPDLGVYSVALVN